MDERACLSRALAGMAGLSVGDAFGQAIRGPDAQARLTARSLPPAPWRWTDDTQTALSVFEELRNRGWIDQDYLARRMAWRYRTDPARGYTPGTQSALERISHGEYFRSVAKSIYTNGSYGFGGAVRCLPVGAYFASQPVKAIREAVLASAITHIHPEALAAAQAVAAAACLAAGESPPAGRSLLVEAAGFVQESALRLRLEKAALLSPEIPASAAFAELSEGAGQTVLETVPFALWCAAHHLADFSEAVWTAAWSPIATDTVCALAGGIASVAGASVPVDWLRRREALPGDAAFAAGGSPAELAAPVPERAQPADLQRMHAAKDPLTGLPNLFAFLKWIEAYGRDPSNTPLAVISIHLVALWTINASQGRTAGDELLRTSASALRSVHADHLYRVSGDRFVVLQPGASKTTALQLAQELSLSVRVAGFEPPRVALISFNDPGSATPGHVLSCITGALADQHFESNDGSPRVFDELTVRLSKDYPWMVHDLAAQVLQLGNTAVETLRLALTDTVSQLPNMRAGLLALDELVTAAGGGGQPLAVLLIDGDNLRRFNEISYETGDEAIRALGQTLKAQLRASDFIARWRTGDEFLVLLPETSGEEARRLGVRLCSAAELASRSWVFPATISIGAAVFPEQGPAIQDLLHAAEHALDRAKSEGKNQVVLAGPGAIDQA